jgi:hypothetical protein
MFFDAFPRFYETSRTSADRGRLNLRYEAIFSENRDLFGGARVLDIASHDGRWSLAALETGAAKVVGIEADAELHVAACENLKEYRVDDGSYRFIAGDVFDVLAREDLEADVVLCLGFLYHTLRYTELLRRIRDIGPRHLVVDTRVVPRTDQPRVFLTREQVGRQANAKDDRFSYRGQTLVGVPSIPALELMLDAYDFEIVCFSDWEALIRDNPSFDPGGYARGHRITVRCASRVPARSAKRAARFVEPGTILTWT